jgi:hypothetical protein
MGSFGALEARKPNLQERFAVVSFLRNQIDHETVLASVTFSKWVRLVKTPSMPFFRV